MPHLSWSPPSLRAYARMQASTASMCLRRLSDWVYSHSKLHADSRFIMVLFLFSSCFLPVFWGDFRFVPKIYIDNPEVMLETTASSGSYVKAGVARSGQLRHILMATTLAPVDSREVVRCDHCH